MPDINNHPQADHMKTTLLVCGKTVDPLLIKLTDEYIKRLTHYTDFEMMVIPDLKNTKAMSEAMQKEKEAELILKAVEGADEVVLLDEHGNEYSSVQFAQKIENWQNRGIRKLVFVIGGPYGFADKVYKRATSKISLSRMTFSHQMVRVIFVEQLYRACTIIKGEPYHHE